MCIYVGCTWPWRTQHEVVDGCVLGVGQAEALGIGMDGGEVQRLDVQVPVEVLSCNNSGYAGQP